MMAWFWWAIATVFVALQIETGWPGWHLPEMMTAFISGCCGARAAQAKEGK